MVSTDGDEAIGGWNAKVVNLDSNVTPTTDGNCPIHTTARFVPFRQAPVVGGSVSRRALPEYRIRGIIKLLFEDCFRVTLKCLRSNTPNMSASEDEVPEIKNQKGRWDKRVAYAVLVIPFLLITLAGLTIVGLVATGTIPINVSIAGTISASNVIAPLVLVFGGLLALTWLLALMKVFGVNPVVWLIQRIANLARDYNPDRDN